MAQETGAMPAGSDRLIKDGFYRLDGRRATGTTRPAGVAVKLKELRKPPWFPGTALYRLDPPVQAPVGRELLDVRYVVVANVPSTPVAGRSVTVLAANGAAGVLGGSVRVAEIGPRLIGRQDHRRVLCGVGGGYAMDDTEFSRRCEKKPAKKTIKKSAQKPVKATKKRQGKAKPA